MDSTDSHILVWCQNHHVILRNCLNFSFCVIVLLGCATVPAPEPLIIPTLPNDWGYNIDLAEARCVPIAGEFTNLGIRQNDNGFRSQDGLLSRHVLTRSLPDRMVADSVAIYSDPEALTLIAELRGQVSRKIETEVSCRSGWHVFTYERSGNYVGDGVVEKQFMHSAWIRQDRDGNLVARVLRNAVYEIRFSEQRSESAEEWYFFQLR